MKDTSAADATQKNLYLRLTINQPRATQQLTPAPLKKAENANSRPLPFLNKKINGVIECFCASMFK
ncbi:hypothetical protein A2331_06610 [Candidatus Falkowbacteria bacterium RIFOXYB2_FULL_34_18]|uniref:Uncharacterized protein n=1 Tax=Candidatus Falkowbacteria bacterium RIFOXYD2_FULL_34_120 TaxID=1798007 RepID=A0A1F5TRS5_9BACT|nr:MAG: hypothetical protein A2331_06610 [Candidatus Falkowbacteria bacterium RIFOXYB2_FULL_34_18]OGF30007.1 MAG: hypothetical protein A2500_04070 [Candidatus Falkowbacteria bacterium RIFOXYC12_FULL_34_55]OGF37136.1 MAG: hypothetical protein A2466_02450 [Candidatus Falkowbacteria bacterium RIFOXYC2_FULL_34_220]OGF39543.1 MAG: hypothetical protein A2515_04435 [Candidatus Falkowbacteria bacterium RIFOXYD12_FULL_34_57]OGF41474.1 MAG: hypothetical protein A2531_02165 [Candidatus Falkowbacteria bact